jgi:hypothetical protein
MGQPTLLTVSAPPEELVLAAVVAAFVASPDLSAAGAAVYALDGDPLKLPEITSNPESDKLPLVRIYPSRLATNQKYEGAYNTTLTIVLEGFTPGTHYADPLRLWSLMRGVIHGVIGTVSAIDGVRCEGFPTMTAAVVRLGQDMYAQKISGSWTVYLDTPVPPIT